MVASTFRCRNEELTAVRLGKESYDNKVDIIARVRIARVWAESPKHTILPVHLRGND